MPSSRVKNCGKDMKDSGKEEPKEKKQGVKKLSEKRQKELTEEVWKKYKETHSDEAREELILYYAPMVKYVAGRVSSGLPPSVEFGDLVSYGVFGLLDAIDKYDPDRGIKFETYAIARIKGAIIDELRADDWVPRSMRFKAREIERAYIELETKLRRNPSDEEVARKLGITLDNYLETLNRLSFISLVALDELWSVGGDKPDQVSLADTVEDVKAKDPSQMFEIEEMKNIIAVAIKKLPERERIVISLYYYEGLTMREIGEALSVTESRVCQLHTKAILRLRARLSQALGLS